MTWLLPAQPSSMVSTFLPKILTTAILVATRLILDMCHQSCGSSSKDMSFPELGVGLCKATLRNARVHLRCTPNVVVRRKGNGRATNLNAESSKRLGHRGTPWACRRAFPTALRAGFGIGLCLALGLTAALGSRARSGRIGRAPTGAVARACLRSSLSWEYGQSYPLEQLP